MSVRLISYLVMNGNAKEAIDFYSKALGAQLLFKQSFGEMPSDPNFPMPEEAKSRIGHAMLRIGESDLMLSDTFPGQPHQSGTQVTICISTDSKEQAGQIFNALQDGGQVSMPLQETFFSPAYAILTDKFGVTFHVFTDKPQ